MRDLGVTVADPWPQHDAHSARPPPLQPGVQRHRARRAEAEHEQGPRSGRRERLPGAEDERSDQHRQTIPAFSAMGVALGEANSPCAFITASDVPTTA